MILDRLTNACWYEGLGERIGAALAFLNLAETARLEPAAVGTANSLRVDVRGDEIFALVQRYQTKLADEAFWEAHRKYIDVQCVMEGVEVMGHAPLELMRVKKTYDEEKDFAVLEPRGADESAELKQECRPSPSLLPLKGEGCNMIRVEAGMFAVFMPHDAHMPGLAVDGRAGMVKKIVVKVRCF